MKKDINVRTEVHEFCRKCGLVFSRREASISDSGIECPRCKVVRDTNKGFYYEYHKTHKR